MMDGEAMELGTIFFSLFKFGEWAYSLMLVGKKEMWGEEEEVCVCEREIKGRGIDTTMHDIWEESKPRWRDGFLW